MGGVERLSVLSVLLKENENLFFFNGMVRKEQMVVLKENSEDLNQILKF